VLGSNPRWAFNPYSLSRGAHYSGHPALRPTGQPRFAPLFQIAPVTLNRYRQKNLNGILLQPGA